MNAIIVQKPDSNTSFDRHIQNYTNSPETHETFLQPKIKIADEMSFKTRNNTELSSYNENNLGKPKDISNV